MKDRAKQGIGLQKRQAQIITPEEEELLWETKTLGIESPEKLLDTLFYLIGLNFALRGGEEHRQLRGGPNSQLRLLDVDTLQYTQDVSKSNQGGLKHKEIAPKQVLAYSIKDKPERCVVAVFKLYMSHCPVPHPGPFYLRPLVNPKGKVWYAKAPIGRHKLSGIVANLCSQAGIGGYRTNHSLRASAATRLYEASVDEQLIAEVTGHRSKAIRFVLQLL